ncbi:hypothetical protein [Nonomuraea typhae]|nr:hypothetical protein [Nonomuraea typhae]
MAEEGELEGDELAGLKLPKLDTKVVPILTLDKLKALINACRKRLRGQEG